MKSVQRRSLGQRGGLILHNRDRQRGGIIFRFLFLLAFLAILGVVYLTRHPLMRLAGNSWVIEDPVEHADAIVVLGDDNFAGDRATRGSELFRAGRADLVVASGPAIRPYVSMAEFIQHDLELRGVPPAAVLRFSHSAADTREEAEGLRSLATQRGWKRILIVTSNYHTRRARYIYRKVFPPGIDVRLVAARDPAFDPDAWWESRKGRKVLFLELVSYTEAWWELRDTKG
jgi:uncharacterized SAM-binding protein YcdF (DUF218 family)